ncbi:MAG: alpha/beta fold hydrolase [Pseudomonadota bacterium]
MLSRLRTGTPVLAATCLAILSGTARADTLPGYDRIGFSAAHRAGLIQGAVWYPMGTMTYRVRIGDNALFKGADVALGAGVKAGRFPLVLLSHGSGGNMDGLAWLASELTAAGYIVLAVNHPGSTSGDSSPRRSMEIWKRAQDLSAALDFTLAEPAFGRHIDRDRVAAMGFSLGGLTVLQLGGLVPDKQAFIDYCARMDGARDCLFLAKGGVSLANIDTRAFERPAREPAVRAVVAVDPGMGFAFKDESVRAANLPIRIINLGDGTDLWPEVDAGPQGSNLAQRLPQGSLSRVTPADHYSFLAECKPGARERLAAEKDDPICHDVAGSVRPVVHQEVVRQTVAFLKTALK